MLNRILMDSLVGSLRVWLKRQKCVVDVLVIIRIFDSIFALGQTKLKCGV